MNKLTEFFSKYIRFIWLGKTNFNQEKVNVDATRIIEINEVNTEEPSEKEIKLTEREIKLRIITQINKLLMGVCITSFVFIFIYSLVYPDKSTPDFMQNVFFTTLGWFGGILGAFFQVDQNK
ncbi:hypothetical protein [Crocosphaera sp.]|uniref:hypothetical protein n=1 Tax=Crocosphaera sp. TaxID=2729996 RepID=UPI002604B00F|nr:hypothetical protein [Crocosphaera sp.]MDJ0580659.1 hypothetical protein [Crocosphaera sp.]